MPDAHGGGAVVTFGPVPQPAPRTALFDSEALYLAIDRKRRRLGISNREILRQAGLGTPSTITRLGQGSSLSADTLVALLTWLGETDLSPYIRRVPVEPAGDGSPDG